MKYFCRLSYLGTAYHGFERQPRLRTIQGTLERVLAHFCGEEILVKGAGRTDSGVHALGQTFSFVCSKDIDTKRFLYATNRLLPDDIKILSIQEVPESFDARHSSCGKRYEYRFTYGPKDPFLKNRVAQFLRDDFDPDLFKKALLCFQGKHNFQNFTCKKEDKDGFIRVIESIDVTIDKDKQAGKVVFLGNHFMTYQVRFMVGCALKVATKKLPLEKVNELLERKPRQIVSFKAPACGLYLCEVYYAQGI